MQCLARHNEEFGNIFGLRCSLIVRHNHASNSFYDITVHILRRILNLFKLVGRWER